MLLKHIFIIFKVNFLLHILIYMTDISIWILIHMHFQIDIILILCFWIVYALNVYINLINNYQYYQ